MLLLACLLSRIAVLHQFWDDLNDDRDAYLGIARQITSGAGFTVPGGDQPTAYRPPLYPLLLTPWAGEEDRLGRAVLHLLASCGTVWLIWSLAGHLGLNRFARTGATLLFVADPLLLRYVTFPMTETVCAFLSALLLWQLSRPGPFTIRSGVLLGITFGACTLCRPTYWVFGGLYVLTKLPQRKWLYRRGQWPARMATVSGVALLMLPWTVRNGLLLGAPVVTTTHGGYTLLLGNNDAFYREVVAQRWGTVWDGSHGPGQSGWIKDVNRELDRLGLTGEVERDRWMSRTARQTVWEQPVLFLRACLLRLLRFWNVVPLGEEGTAYPAWIRAVVGTFYSVYWISALAGCGLWLWDRAGLWTRSEAPRETTPAIIADSSGTASSRETQCSTADRGAYGSVPDSETIRSSVRHRTLLACFLLVAAFMLLHLVYWSNARMRAPVMPALAVLTVWWMGRRPACAGDDGERGT